MTDEEKKFKKEVDETLTSIYSKINVDEKIFLSDLINKFNLMCNRNFGAIEYIKENRKEMLDGGKDLLKILEGKDEEKNLCAL